MSLARAYFDFPLPMMSRAAILASARTTPEFVITASGHRFSEALCRSAKSSCAATQEEIRKRVGIYAWGQFPSEDTPALTAAVKRIKALGGDSIRFALTPYDSDDPSSLCEKMDRPDINDALHAFPVVMLTTFEGADYFLKHRNKSRLSAEEWRKFLEDVREENRCATYKLADIDGTFLLSNWETRNDLPVDSDEQSEQTDIEGYVEWLNARTDGQDLGRQQAKIEGRRGTILIGFELRNIPGYAGDLSDLELIGSKVNHLDFLSYSSWASIGFLYSPEILKESFYWGIKYIRDYAWATGLPTRLVIGEFGDVRDYHPDVVERLKAIIDVSIENGVEHLFNWVLYDQPGEKNELGLDVSHFGSYTQQGDLTLQGEAFEEWFGVPSDENNASQARQKTTQ